MHRIAVWVALFAIAPPTGAQDPTIPPVLQGLDQQCRADCAQLVKEGSIRGAPPAKAPANIRAGFCSFLCACTAKKLDLGTIREGAQGRSNRMNAQQAACVQEWAAGNQNATLDYSRKRVIVCTPHMTDSRGDFTPDSNRAMKDGRLAKHWKDVDEQLTALKAEKAGFLQKAGAQAKEVVTVILNDYRTPGKLREVLVDRDCPPRHGVEQHDFETWMRAPGRKGK